MKGKRTIKTIAIAISAVVLFAVATTGTIVYLKDNGSAEAKAKNERNIVETLPVTDDKEEAQDIETIADNQQEGETDEDLNVTENADTIQQNTTQENRNTDNQTTTQESRNADNQTTAQSTGNATTNETTTTEAEDTPTQEYIQTETQTRTEIIEEPWETKSVGWFPKTLELDVNDIDINKPKFETRKTATVNADENVTTVFRGDIITYKIYVKNTGTVKFENITVSDTIPEGTIYVEESIDKNGNISEDGELTWKIDLNAGEEVVVSYKVRVILETDLQEEEIIQIDNTAKVNGEDTNTTHNPTITFDKQVKVITVNGQELENQIVAPGTRLRYYINLTNDSEYDATTRVTDIIPEGTSLIKGTISEGGAQEEGNEIVWEKVSIPAGETVNVSFDVTVNNNRKETVSNVAKIGAEKTEEQDEVAEEQYTNTVKTPVFKASKQSSSDYNSQDKTPKLHETNEVTYIVTVTNSASTDDPDTASLTGTAKLEDKFWINDSNKMTYKSGTLVIKDNSGTEVFSKENIQESFLSNIEITLEPGQTATLTYIYSINEMKNPTIETKDLTNKVAWDEISNNLYWAEPTENDPSRPQNPNDTTNCNNIENPDDPTDPTADPADPEKPGLIDTVIIHVEEESIAIEAIKKWIDYENKYLKRPDFVNFTLYRNEISTGITLSPTEQTDWKVEFNNLRKTDTDGNPYVYTIIEDEIEYYKTPTMGRIGSDNKITITNYLDQLFIAEKKSSKEGLTIKEREDIDYTITVYNIGDEDGTTSIRDVYRSGDEEKFDFKSGTVEYYNSTSDEAPTTIENITSQDYLNNKITLNIKGNGKAVIKYICTAKTIDENKTPDSDGIIREQIVNDLYWAKTNDTDPDDPRYPTDEVIDTVTVNLEKEYTEVLATKIWDDETDKSKRPETIKFVLQKWNSTTSQFEDVTTTDDDGGAINVEKTLSAANALSEDQNKWQVKFEKLFKYDEAGNENVYAIREEAVAHYITRYSEDRKTVTNVVGENIQAQVITSNANIPTVPMDVVFVLDVSSSMLKDPGNINLTNGNNNKVATAKAITMVDAVNTAIDKVLESNPENRVAVQLYNSRIESTDYAYYLIELDNYNRNSNGKYITYTWSTTGRYYNNLYRYDGVLTTNLTKASTGEAVSKVGKVLVAKSYSEENIIGTYTQAGIQRGEQILTGATDKMVTNQDFTRIPVLILVTDGDPTHYNPRSVGTSNIISSTDPERTTYPTSGSRIPREKHSSAEYYYYTIKQLEASKNTISASYSSGSSLARTCRVYTIGIGLRGSMAETLLNPSLDYIQNHLEDVDNINPNITNRDGHYGYNNTDTEGTAFYTEQQTKLKKMLLGQISGITKLENNYTDRSFNIQSTQSSTLSTELAGAFYESLQDSQVSVENRTVGEDRRIDLTDIAVNRGFEIIITGTDYNDNAISVNKSFETFNEALADSTVSKYIKGSYYIDLSDLKSGSVTVTYVKNNQI